MLDRIIKFVKYHNAFTIILAVLILGFSGAMASETVREATLGRAVVEKSGVDNSLLLSANLNNFDFQMQVSNVAEDEENYYVGYSYRTLGVEDNVWRQVVKEGLLDISKEFLGRRDLGLYVAEELGEIVDTQLAFLKKVQKKEVSQGKTFVEETTKYTGLIGLVLDPKTKQISGYEPVVVPAEPTMEFPEPQPEPAAASSSSSESLFPENLIEIEVAADATTTGITAEENGGQAEEKENQSEEPFSCENDYYYLDIDGDGYGCSGNFYIGCNPPEGYADNEDDCNDFKAEINPGAPELCDEIDNNCDGAIDEGCATSTDEFIIIDDSGGNDTPVSTSTASSTGE